MTVRKTIFVVIFFFFMYPISSADGYSINYSFLMLPLVYLLIYGKVRMPQKFFILLMVLFTLIFLIAYMYQHEFYDNVLRRIISFFLFMGMFSYFFIKIDAEMIESFKISIVAISLYFSLHAMYSFYMLGGSNLGWGAKDIVGGQRFGFIYLLGIWLTYFYQRHETIYFVIKYSILLILLVGLFLTFSRTSIVSLLCSFAIFTMVNCLRFLRRPNLKMSFKGFFSIVGVVLLIVLLYQLVPVTFNFFDERLFSHLSDSGAIRDDIGNPESSGGTRVLITGKILDFVVHNPLTGSGFLGVWILENNLFRSAHNQFLDVLFRTGLFGFFAYLYLLFLLIRYLKRNEPGLFWGLVSILIYGMFHETFKESHGGFVLAFLLGMTAQSLKKTKVSHVPGNIVGTRDMSRSDKKDIPARYPSI